MVTKGFEEAFAPSMLLHPLRSLDQRREQVLRYYAGKFSIIASFAWSELTAYDPAVAQPEQPHSQCGVTNYGLGDFYDRFGVARSQDMWYGRGVLLLNGKVLDRNHSCLIVNGRWRWQRDWRFDLTGHQYSGINNSVIMQDVNAPLDPTGVTYQAEKVTRFDQYDRAKFGTRLPELMMFCSGPAARLAGIEPPVIACRHNIIEEYC